MPIADFLPWLQLAALIVAATVGVQAIRTTTASLKLEITHLRETIDMLKTAINMIEGRVVELEKQKAYERGVHAERDRMRQAGSA